MIYKDFLERVINEGIEAAKESYKQEYQKEKLEGAIAGFEACRGKNPVELVDEYSKALKLQQEAYVLHVDNYWWFRCYTLEIEWVINVISAGTRLNMLSHLPTSRGVFKAAQILGISEDAREE